jgi:hypothetical protein
MAPGSRANSRHVLLLVVAIALARGAVVSAHRLDEYLQAARIAIEPDRVQVELTLTPGISVAAGIIRTIDADGDGVLSPDEQQAYAERVLDAISLRVDEGRPLQMRRVSSTFPDVHALRTGDAAIDIRSEAVVTPLAEGPHRVFYRNGHDTARSVYLANALVPTNSRIAVTGQQRDGAQSELAIDFTVERPPLASFASLAPWAPWGWMLLAGALIPLTSLLRSRRASTSR